MDDALPFGVGFVREAAAGAAAGVVEENVDRAVGLRGLGDGVRDGVVVADIAGDEGRFAAGIAQRGLDGSALLLAPRHEDHFGTLLDEELCRALADPAVAAGDDRDLACQSICHVRVLLVWIGAAV